MDFITSFINPNKKIFSEKVHSFIHFGCWNNLNIKKDKPLGGLNVVMNTLKQYVDARSDDIDFIVIAGDNYYPFKQKTIDDKKQKIIFPDKLAAGFELLPKDKKCYMVLGNHDLETNLNGGNLYIESERTIEPDNECTIIKIQRDILQRPEMSNIEYAFLKMEQITNTTLVIMFDSSVFLETMEAASFLPCYKKFLKDDADFNQYIESTSTVMDTITIQTIREYITSRILTRLGDLEEIRFLIFSGHHPILSKKYKEKKQSRKYIITNELQAFKDEILKPVYDLTKTRVEYFYLCADLHLYQSGDVNIRFDTNETMIIHQHIVGTGGTELDDGFDKDGNEMVDENGESLSVVNQSDTDTFENIRTQPTHGFLHCTTTTSGPIFEFIPAVAGEKMGSGGSSGGRNKQTRRKNKQTRCKNKQTQTRCKCKKRHTKSKRPHRARSRTR